MPQFKVLKCEKCNTLTYKRVDHQTVRCPTCQTKLQGEPLKICDDWRTAMQFIKDEQLKNAPKGGALFERFG
jgi:ribosomal protein L37AE/L43A